MQWLGFGLCVAMVLFVLAIVLEQPQLMLAFVGTLIVIFFGVALRSR